MNTQTTTPLDIAVDMKQSMVRITWQDGKASEYTFATLRKNCPCAMCEDNRKKAAEDPLFILPPDLMNPTAELDATHPADKVGQYALQFFWADGHRAGIYTYKFLRALTDKQAGGDDA